jgi:DNA-binding SARP family transcriptional activator/TolB-like protein
MLALQLFGPPVIEGEAGPLNGRAAQRHRLALLALLSASPGHQLSRDKLLAYLWPDADMQRARHLLNVSVHVLRKELGENALVTTNGDLRLNTEVVRSDVAEFETALGQGEAERAVALYTAPFLDGFHLHGSVEFERWLDGERDRLAGLYGRALATLAAEAEARNDTEAAVRWWRQLATHNPYGGRIAVGLMRALEASGDHGGAIRYAVSQELLLLEELGATPDPEVQALLEQLRTEPNRRSVDRAQLPSPISSASSEPAQKVTAHKAPAERPATHRKTGGLRRRRALNGRAARGGIAVALIGIVAAAVIVEVSSREAPELDSRRILVASFENRTGDASLDPLGDMAADWIQQGLAGSGLVKVVDQATALLSSNHVEEAGEMDSTVRVRELALEAEAGTVVSGSFYREAGSLAFVASVTDANTNQLLVSLDDVRSDYEDPLAGVDRLRTRVMGGLATLFDDRLASLTTISSVPPTYEAYRAFMKGLDGYVRRDYKTAIEQFNAARSRTRSCDFLQRSETG